MEKTNETGVYRKKDGRLWVRAAIKDPTGGTLEKTRTMKAGQTMEEATATRDRLIDELRTLRDNQETDTESVLRPTTLADYVEQWLARKSVRRAPSTIDKYTVALSHHVLPELGHLRLDELSRDDVEQWVAWAERQEVEDGVPYALDTIRTWWSVLRNVLRDAYAEEFLGRDVTMRVTLPEPTTAHLKRGQVHDKDSLTVEELRELLAGVREYDELHASRWHIEVLVLSLTGMRSSELYGLKWDSLDFDRNEIRVSARAWRGTLGRPKTGKVKTVPFTDALHETLLEHRLWQLERQHPGLRAGLVFPSVRGTPRNSGPLNNVLADVVERTSIDFDVRTHTFRRTLRTLLRRGGVHDNVAKAITGHVTDEMAERYDRVSLADKRAAVVSFSELIA